MAEAVVRIALSRHQNPRVLNATGFPRIQVAHF